MAADSVLANPPVRQVRPQLGPIKALHRHDGYISFAVTGDESDWRQVVSIRASALDEWFPEFTQQLLRDSLVSINASYCLANRRMSEPHGRPLHRNETLRYLCACYSDLDYYKVGLRPSQVIGELARMSESGGIPQSSMHIDSGRGMWLLWLLHDEDDSERAHLSAYDLTCLGLEGGVGYALPEACLPSTTED